MTIYDDYDPNWRERIDPHLKKCADCIDFAVLESSDLPAERFCFLWKENYWEYANACHFFRSKLQ